MTRGGSPGRKGSFGWLRAVDDGVFAVEQAIVVLALLAITVLMFVNVVARRIQAPDSKVGAVIAKLGGIDDLATRELIDANVAPWVTLAGSFALIVFAYFTRQRFARRRRGDDPPPPARTLAVGAALAVAIIAATWGFTQVFGLLASKHVFAALFGASAAAVAVRAAVRKPPYWWLRAAASVLVGVGVVWFCVRWFPIGYTWTNKVSLMLLLWVGLLGASVCVHEGKHIRMEALGKLAPESWRRFIAALGFLVAAGFSALMTWLGIVYVFWPTASDDPALPEMVTLFGTRYVFGGQGAYGLEGVVEGTDIPDWVGTFSVVVGFGLATVRFAGASVSSVAGGSYGAPATEEAMEDAQKAAAGGDPDEAPAEAPHEAPAPEPHAVPASTPEDDADGEPAPNEPPPESHAEPASTPEGRADGEPPEEGS